MITVNDLQGKDIPVSGICPICFDLNHHNDHEWERLRSHLVQSHGLKPLGNSKRVQAWVERNREKYNEKQRGYQKKYKKKKKMADRK